jgi:hypothetical protein
MPELDEITKVATRQQRALDVCRDYCRQYLQDEADGWLTDKEWLAAVREMFDALGLEYRIDDTADY